MTDTIRRAGVAVINAWHGLKDCPGDMYQQEAEALAGAALDAALDPEDPGLSLAIVRACIKATTNGGQTIHREVIAAIKAHAQGEQ